MIPERNIENPNVPPADATGEVPASPEEEAIMAQAVDAAEEHIHGPMRDAIIQELQQGPPHEAVAQISYGLVTKMNEQKPMPPEILQELAAHIVEMVVEIADAAGIAEASEQLVQESFLEMVRMHGQSMEGQEGIQEEAAMMMGQMDPGATEAAMAELGGMRPVAAGVQGGLHRMV